MAAVAGAGLVVLAVVAGAKLFAPGGKLLTITKPEHGTIVGNGLECGSDGRAVRLVSDGDMMQLRALADEGYTFKVHGSVRTVAGRVL